MAKSLCGKELITQLNYELEESKRSQYKATYKLDLSKAGEKRWLWVHQELCVFHAEKGARAYPIPIMPISVGDSFEIAINIFSLRGALDFSSCHWEELMITN